MKIPQSSKLCHFYGFSIIFNQKSNEQIFGLKVCYGRSWRSLLPNRGCLTEDDVIKILSTSFAQYVSSQAESTLPSLIILWFQHIQNVEVLVSSLTHRFLKINLKENVIYRNLTCHNCHVKDLWPDVKCNNKHYKFVVCYRHPKGNVNSFH